MLGTRCGGGGKATDSPSTKSAAPDSATSSGSKEPTAAPSGPTSTTGAISDEPIAFQTGDGVTLHGHLYSSPGPKKQAVIFTHMFPNDQRAWQGFAKELAGQGVAAMTFDFRGYGESGGSKDPSKIDRDLTSALLLLKSRDYPLIYLVGASMGGTAVLKVAAAQDIAGIVTVSAPIEFMGLDARQDVAKIKVPKRFLGSKNEAEGGGQSALEIYGLAGDPKSVFLFDGAAHGTDLLQGANATAFKQQIASFVLQQ